MAFYAAKYVFKKMKKIIILRPDNSSTSIGLNIHTPEVQMFFLKKPLLLQQEEGFKLHNLIQIHLLTFA
jgi:hypothetical protein